MQLHAVAAAYAHATEHCDIGKSMLIFDLAVISFVEITKYLLSQPDQKLYVLSERIS